MGLMVAGARTSYMERSDEIRLLLHITVLSYDVVKQQPNRVMLCLFLELPRGWYCCRNVAKRHAMHLCLYLYA